MSDLIHPLDAYRAQARANMEPAAWAYLNGGAVDEITVRRNSDYFAGIRLLPRVGVDVGNLDTSQRLFGIDMPFPILLAPAALQRLFADAGERGTVEGAKAADAVTIISMETSVATRELAPAAGPFLQHLYIQRDRQLTRELVRLAEDVGARGIVVTLDNPVPGIRYRQDAGMMGLPSGIGRANLESGGVPLLTGGYLDPSVTWDDVEWLVSLTDLPVIGKGILHPDDAVRAVDAGMGGVIVSNHGGRNIDTVAHPMECVRAVSDAVAGRVPVLLDGGIRRGTDVLKALAFGADAVLIGRPYVWGLAAAGAAGVADVIRIMREEFASAMAMCGIATLSDITPALIVGNEA
ncbi:alpha-hydroxy acid oxidase [Microbacterium sp. MYb66]|uniref:alpha-hydroxy acid oxidase n=1 Tax=Microbacterium sp. MYb66 TaxID=1848692 RepID=UPI000CFEEA3B|nr:alpha-hydroxy acid oxidase [Microbacterium sp. MYb66]PRA81377.1 alpha-hydroxy-acid oxidizing enzyme [Microbacterium sp. MYb66]